MVSSSGNHSKNCPPSNHYAKRHRSCLAPFWGALSQRKRGSRSENAAVAAKTRQSQRKRNKAAKTRCSIQIDLSGRRALVCGASKGIGQAIAIELSRAGADLVLLARDANALKATKERLSGPGTVQVIEHDLSNYESLTGKINTVVENGGPIDILINNAGGPASGPLTAAEPQQFLQAFTTHVLAAHTLTQLLTPQMKAAKFGRIINIISTSVKAPIPNLGVSNTIRGAMANWAKTLSLELGPFGITVNNVLPGYTATERLNSLKKASADHQGVKPEDIEKGWLAAIPAGRFADPHETAHAVVFLASPQAAYVNGINLPVDGGRTASL